MTKAVMNLNVSNMLVGAMRGTLYGALGGLVLGAVGHAFGGKIDFEAEMIWRDAYGKRQRFQYLSDVDTWEIGEDLYSLYKYRSNHKEAVDEICRNVQSFLILYHRFAESGSADAGSVASATGYAVRAGQSVRALKESTSITDCIGSDIIQKSGMNLQLSIEELINQMRIAASKSVG
jgi:hypothetical protein